MNIFIDGVAQPVWKNFDLKIPNYDNIEKYYNTGLEEGDWVSFFDFASWLYEDAQADVFKAFEYLLERGVRPAFAIETLKAGTDGMWYPRRKHLIDGGVLTQ